MHYCQLYLRGTKGFFTWETSESISVGARVVVKLRNRKKIGLVIGISQTKPEFKTLPILEVFENPFIDARYIEIARQGAKENFCSLEKVLSLMIPDKFFQTRHPEKREIYFTLSQKAAHADFDGSLKGPKQKLAVQMIRDQDGEISESDLRKKISLDTVKSLLKKNIIRKEAGALTGRGMNKEQKLQNGHALTLEQYQALSSIRKAEQPVVLFGVTGSGKTEIYKQLARDILEKDASAQVLFLCPEIALTTHLITDFRKMFGKNIALWHSQLSEGEKVQEFFRLITGEAQILIGARSAAFVPLQNPKLIILDEEHEWTFKSETNPRLWTHDLVQNIGQEFCSKIVFGSATPRLESFVNCAEGGEEPAQNKKNTKKWQRVDLRKRVFETKMPELQIVDLKNETKKGNFSPISEYLAYEIKQMLKAKRQAVLFLNKRGFSGATFCKVCGHTFACPDCSANMKLHRKLDDPQSRLKTGKRPSATPIEMEKFICHVCGHLEPYHDQCPECRAEDFRFRGWGTQQVEAVLTKQFPGIRVLRADADSVTGRYDFERILDQFHRHEYDILLGTQMIAKGLDFEKVELVGVVLADVGLSLPDFRAEERVFQLLTQVAGRAGRRKKQGKIVLQTYHPEEKIFEYVRHNDTEGFVSDQLEHRKNMTMSPFVHLAKITFSHEDKHHAFTSAKKFYEDCRKNKKESIFDVHFAPAFFPKSHKKYHFHVVLKAYEKQTLIDFFVHATLPDFARIDLDPVSVL